MTKYSLTLPKPSPNPNIIIKYKILISMGVSICLDRDSQSRHWQRAGLDSRENLNTFKKLVSTIKIYRLRSRNLDFVSTPPSSPKSLDRDREICRDMTFLANLDSLSRSRSRVSQFYHISRSRFLNLSRFFTLKYLKKSR
jgi:hypothetical protein